MDLESHTVFLRRAIELARKARTLGNHPFGAVVTLADGEVISATNSVVSDADCTCHAEMNAIRMSLRGRQALGGGTLFSSTEPCVMCAGAAYWAGVSRIVFGCSASRLGQFTGGSLVVSCRSVLEKGRRKVEIIGPLIEDVAASVHEGFWG